MSKVSQCPKCRGNIVEPAFEGDGAYPVAPMCECVNHFTAPRADDRRGKWLSESTNAAPEA